MDDLIYQIKYYLGRYFCNRKRSLGYTISFTRITIPFVLYCLGVTGEILSFYSGVTVLYFEILSNELIAFYKMNPEPKNQDYTFLLRKKEVGNLKEKAKKKTHKTTVII